MKALAILALVASCLGASGCVNGRPDFPTIDRVFQVVVADLAAGYTDAQIASDVCKALGGTGPTDAVCADVTSVIADVIALILKEPTVSAPVKSRALLYQAAHATR